VQPRAGMRACDGFREAGKLEFADDGQIHGNALPGLPAADQRRQS
jgi:hypothetical protein